MTKQFALDEFRRNSCTVNLDKWAICTIALIVKPTRHKLLTRTILTHYKYSGIGLGNLIECYNKWEEEQAAPATENTENE